MNKNSLTMTVTNLILQGKSHSFKIFLCNYHGRNFHYNNTSQLFALKKKGGSEA